MTRKTRLNVDMISESEFTVQGHGVHTAFVEMTNALKARKDTSVVVNQARSDADIVHAQTIGLYSMWMLKRSRGKKIISGHVIPASLVGSIKGMGRMQWLVRAYMRWVYNQADLVLACSNMVKETMTGPMKLKTRVEVLYNTVDMSRYASTAKTKQTARKKLKLKPSDFVVVGNGQVQPRKRLDTFFETARALPEVTFIWVGGIPFKHLGAEYGKMQELIASAPKNVIITGVIDHADVMTYLHAADAFFLPAEQENHPMCVLEAAGAGLPIILRDIHEYDDTFRPDAQFVSSAQDAARVIDKLRNDAKWYKQQVAAAGRIAKRFDSRAGGERLVEFYRSVLES